MPVPGFEVAGQEIFFYTQSPVCYCGQKYYLSRHFKSRNWHVPLISMFHHLTPVLSISLFDAYTGKKARTAHVTLT